MKFIIISLFLLLLFAVVLNKGQRRAILTLIGLFVFNTTISIQPFDSYTLLCSAFTLSLIFHKDFRSEWKNFPYKSIMLLLLIVHICVVVLDPRVSGLLKIISRIFNNFVPRYWALFVGYSMVGSLRIARGTCAKLCLLFGVMTIYGCVTYILQGNPYDNLLHLSFGDEVGIWSNVQTRGYRVFSTLNNPIVYGFVMCMAASLVYLFREGLSKASYITLILLCLLNVFLANSRTGVVCGLLLVVLFLLLKNGISIRLVGSSAVIALLFSALYYTIPFVKEASDSVFDIFLTGGENTGGSTVELKDNQLDISLLLFAIHPYFGHGFNYFQEVIIEKDASTLEVLAGMEGFGYKLLIEEGVFMIIAVDILFFALVRDFFKLMLNTKSPLPCMGIAWTVSFLVFLLLAGIYGGIFTIGMILIGMLLRISVLSDSSLIEKDK